LNTITGKGPSAAGASGVDGAVWSPLAGYQTSVVIVRLGSSGDPPKAGVERVVSTRGSDRVPTA
jgi:hypothetical protein